LLASAATLEAQFAEGNSDKDGTVVPKFPVPGGSTSIRNGGEGSIAIPLPVPPGIGGMAPSPTLRYSSGGPDEGLGAGWSLDLGYPDAIRRVTRFGVPSYGPGDVFTFNGQDLVQKDGGARYRTRIDSFQKIERVGDGWVVRDKTGTMLVYGDTGGSRSEIAGKGTYAWHLSRVEDTFGKGIAFTYEGPADARRLGSIVYTVRGGTAAGQEQKVQLQWQARPDPRRSASYGGEVVQDQRLDRVETFSSAVGANALRTFELCYEGEACTAEPTPIRGHSRLAALLQTSRDGTTLPDTRFRYQERSPGWTPGGPTTPFGFVHQITANDLRAVDTGVRLADVNGDGFVDMVRGREPVAAPFERVFLHDGQTGWLPAASWQVPLAFIELNRLSREKDLGVQLVDVNGDSLPDIVQSVDVIKLSVPSTQEQTVRRIWLNNGHGWHPTPDCGVPEPAGYCFPPLTRTQPGSTFPFREFHFTEITDDLWSYPGGAQLADVNGDGLPDLVTARESRGRLVYLNNGRNGWSPVPAGAWSLPEDLVRHDNPGNTPVDNGIRFLDLNADSLPDLVRAYYDRDLVAPDGPILEVRLNNGSGWDGPGAWNWPGSDTPADNTDDLYFGAVTRSGQSKVYWDYGVQVVDVDGDRFPDIVYRVGAAPGKVLLNNQSGGFVAAGWDVPVSLVAQVRTLDLGSILVGNMDNGVRVVDADGDGLSDLVYGLFVNGTAQTPLTYLANRGQADLLVEHGNPLGGLATIEYGSVSGLGLPPGQMPFVRTVAVLLTQESSLGDPALVESYRYAGGVFDRRQRDFRGFANVIDTRADGSERERSFYLDEGRKGIQRGEGLRDSDGQYYSAHPQTYSSTADAERVYRTLLASELFVQFHQDDQGQWVRRSVDYTHDAHGNLLTTRESDWGRTQRVCGPPLIDVRLTAARRRAAAAPPPDTCRDEFQAGAVLRSTRTRFTAPNEDLWIVGLRCAVERFEGDLLTPGNVPLATQELYYEGGGVLCARAGQDRLTRDVLVDHRLTGLTLASGSDSESKSYLHDDYGNVTEERPGRGEPTLRSYEGNGFLLPYETRRGLLRTITVHDRGHGKLLEYRDPNDQVTSHSYDGLGRLRSTTHPDFPADPTLGVSYELAARPAYIEIRQKLDERRTRTTREYRDGLGRMKGNVSGSGSDWTVSGLVAFDERGRARTAYEPFFQSSAVLPASRPAGLATVFDYEDDKVSVTTLPGGDRTSSYYQADAVLSTDENGVVTFRRHDAFGQLVEVRNDEGGAMSPQPISRFGHDGLGRLAWSEDPRGLRTTYLHDVLGRLRGLVPPDGAETLLNGYQVWNDYDENGNHTHRWAGSDVSLTEFDGLDRPTNLYVSLDGLVSRYGESTRSYDQGQNGIGRLTGILGYGPPTTSSTLHYDVRGRVSEEAFALQGLDATLPAQLTVGYAYDREGALASIRDPRGHFIQYARNTRGQLDDSFGSPVSLYAGQPDAVRISNIDYDASGRLTAIQYAHGALDVFEHDARGRVSTIGGNGPLQISYGYDPVGHLLSDTQPGFLALTHTYDRLNRLESSNGTTTRGGVSLSYGYDLSSNLLSVTGQGAPNVVNTLAPGTNRLATVQLAADPLVEAVYDPHGNLTGLVDTVAARYVRRFGYDALGRLRGYQVSASPHYRTGDGMASVAYDGYGRKVRRNFPGGGSEVYVHTISGQVLATYKKASWTTYLLADGKRLGWADAQGYGSYIHSDRLGSARAISVPDSEQDCGDDIVALTKKIPEPCSTSYRVTWRGEYLPFGQEIERRAGADDFRFTGQEMDEGMGVYDYGARYYDPLLGRFLQVDSYLGKPAQPGSLNRYSYALNNPLTFVDPTGHCTQKPGDPPCDKEERERLLTPVEQIGEAFSQAAKSVIRWLQGKVSKKTEPEQRPAPQAPAQQAEARGNGYGSPLQQTVVTSAFGPRTDPLNAQAVQNHQGTDLRAADSTAVQTVAGGGVVTESGNGVNGAAGGESVTVNHGDSVLVMYMHLSQRNVQVDSTLGANAVIGLSGQTGTRVTGPHLHIQTYRRSETGTWDVVNPATLIPALQQR